MEFEFDPDLEYQQEAVDAVTDVFDGQPNIGEQPAFGTHGTTVPNELALSEEQLTANTRKVQRRHDLAQSDDLYRAADGETIGILPTDDRRDANPHVTTPIATGLGHARNALVVMNGDAAVAVDGAGGTLSEIGLALAQGRPVAGIDTHDVDGVEAVDSPTAAVTYVERAAGAD